MDAKEYLGRIKKDREEIRQLKERKKNIHLNIEFITGIDYSGDKVQTSPKDRLEEKAWKMLQRVEGIDERIGELTLEIDSILSTISHLDKAEYSRVLYERYSKYKSIDEIAAELNYSYDYARGICREALAEVEKVLNRNT